MDNLMLPNPFLWTSLIWLARPWPLIQNSVLASMEYQNFFALHLSRWEYLPFMASWCLTFSAWYISGFFIPTNFNPLCWPNQAGWHSSFTFPSQNLNPSRTALLCTLVGSHLCSILARPLYISFAPWKGTQIKNTMKLWSQSQFREFYRDNWYRIRLPQNTDKNES